MDFCTSVRFFGLVGLSGPMPPTVEQNVPDVKQMGASAARYTAAARGARCVRRDGLWRGARACVHVAPDVDAVLAAVVDVHRVYRGWNGIDVPTAA